jgi:RNA polymerase sigma-70 factor (ECF subfamily)
LNDDAPLVVSLWVTTSEISRKAVLDRVNPSRTSTGTRGGSTPANTESFDVEVAFDEHGTAMLGFAINVLRDRSLAEDCIQETFLRAWRARATFDPARGSLRTWLFAIERNVITDLRRSISRMPIVVSDRADEERADSHDATAESDERMRVVEALALLSREHREVVVAVYLAGRSYAQCSETSGVPVATLRTRAYYALKILRTHFDNQEDR